MKHRYITHTKKTPNLYTETLKKTVPFISIFISFMSITCWVNWGLRFCAASRPAALHFDVHAQNLCVLHAQWGNIHKERHSYNRWHFYRKHHGNHTWSWPCPKANKCCLSRQCIQRWGKTSEKHSVFPAKIRSPGQKITHTDEIYTAFAAYCMISHNLKIRADESSTFS